MRALDRFVVDTNVFVSAIALPRSVPRHAVDKALARGLLLFSEATLGELSEVLFRSKFDHYSSSRGHPNRFASFKPFANAATQRTTSFWKSR